MAPLLRLTTLDCCLADLANGYEYFVNFETILVPWLTDPFDFPLGIELRDFLLSASGDRHQRKSPKLTNKIGCRQAITIRHHAVQNLFDKRCHLVKKTVEEFE